MTKLLTLSCVAALSIAALAGAAQAQPVSDGPQSLRVSYRDLDLTSREGQKALAGRVHAAAVRVCGPSPYFSDLASRDVYRECIRDALSGAQGQMREAIASASGAGEIHLAQAEPRR